ncbi:hypothetical protein G7Y89_g3885 [Cudoniella acicularis]|uniref:Protein-S-isoprenylcysteine O-methyltransferase n=1 Tax=Cudoniella acicularis TaxID=354080 RepID=A0A8H4W4S4_9HELO|nr:hypothetical protein G7Y89_g3885 [Cudoniella acicularis]
MALDGSAESSRARDLTRTQDHEEGVQIASKAYDVTKTDEPSDLSPEQGEYANAIFAPRINRTQDDTQEAVQTQAQGLNRRNPFHEATSLINHGGLGTGTQTPSLQTNTPSPSEITSEITSALNAYEKAFYPGQPKSLSGIAIRSFLLGTALAFTSILSLYLVYAGNPVWRAPFFLSTLSLFHFLEFYTTALANTSDAKISSFLLTSNGSAYTIAHTAAFTETLLSHYFLPASILPKPIHFILLLAGLGMIAVGQAVRATAMLQAGSNFSHIVAHTKKATHALVTTGMYSVLRHPSYFGFFWWGIGTQLVCGNAVCLAGYGYVLWRFFDRRISGEEELLVGFFGEEYVNYRARTPVGIPFIK